MFTGLIERQGRILGLIRNGESSRIKIEFTDQKSWGILSRGESISVDGVCLTVIESDGKTFICDLSEETLQRTNFNKRTENSLVNLERPLRLSDRLHGHFVTGHVDGVEKIINIESEGNGVRMTFSLDEKFQTLIREKGSVAYNGISLTVANVFKNPGSVSVALIPETLKKTNLGSLKTSDTVNVEYDLIAKYIVQQTPENEGVNEKTLMEAGWS